MSGGQVLIAGKTVIWFALPLIWGAFELRKMKRIREEDARRKAAEEAKPDA